MTAHALRRRPSPQIVLKLDAAVTAANGAAYLAAAGPLESLLGVPADALRAIGAFLLAFSAFVWFARSRAAVTAVVAGNAAWVAASLAVLVSGTFSPSTAGAVWIALQALVVGGFAALQARR